MTLTNNCILCNEQAVFPIIFKKNRKPVRRYIRCPECDLIFVPEDFHLSPTDEAERYLLHDNNFSNEGYVNMFKEKIDIVLQHCPGINSALDYGCGPVPVLAGLLKTKGIGCDVFDPAFFPGHPGHSYDLIISTETFEHFRDVRKELENIRSHMETGGYLAVMTAFHDPVNDFENWWYISDPTHICFFSMRTFEWISGEFGFEIAYTDRKNFIIFKNA